MTAKHRLSTLFISLVFILTLLSKGHVKTCQLGLLSECFVVAPLTDNDVRYNADWYTPVTYQLSTEINENPFGF
jgi:hypothetical protein